MDSICQTKKASIHMIEKFKTLFFVKSSLISLYLALTIPIPFISSEKLKILSILTFFFGLFLIINITNDYVNTCDKKISYETSFISKTSKDLHL